jgi:hypothetical protein
MLATPPTPALAVTLPSPATAAPPTSSSPDALAPSPGPELTLAAEWLAAFRRRDMPAIEARSRYPFELRDTGEEGHCPARARATDAAALSGAMACLLNDELLASLLRARPNATLQALPEGFVSTWAARWRSELRPGDKPVTLHVSRSDASFALILLVARDGVGGVWKTGTDATAEVALATEWVAALRRRDLPALTRATHYPFELRQSGPAPGCEDRTAFRAAELPAAIDCLLGDEVFGRALAQASHLALEAGPRRGDVPVAFDGWRPADAAQLWPTSAHLEAAGDDGVDLAVWVGSDGVHAVWKRAAPALLDPARLRRGLSPRPAVMP